MNLFELNIFKSLDAKMKDELGYLPRKQEYSEEEANQIIEAVELFASTQKCGTVPMVLLLRRNKDEILNALEPEGPTVSNRELWKIMFGGKTKNKDLDDEADWWKE